MGGQLAIVDVDTGVVTNFCIPGYNSRYEGSSYSPVWSPDGNYLAVMIPDPDISHKKDVLIVNLKSDTAFKVIENARVLGLGWLTTK
jgi:Tol biopolymer transport system component